jgi:exonuclease III
MPAMTHEDRFLEHQLGPRRIEIVEQFLREEAPHILCLQETKVIDGDFPAGAVPRARL